MERLSLVVVGAALVLVPRPARAGSVDVGWTEHWAPLTRQLYAEGRTGGSDHYLSFQTDFAITRYTPSGRTTWFVAAYVNPVSSAGARWPDKVNGNYTLSLMVTDEDSNAFKVLSFHGHLSGTFWKGHTSLTNGFTDKAVSFYLGGNTYTAALVSFGHARGSAAEYLIGADVTVVVGHHLPPPPPTQRAASRVTADLRVASFAAPAPQGAPEPGTLLLGGLGAAAVGVHALWLRRRRRGAPCAAEPVPGSLPD